MIQSAMQESDDEFGYDFSADDEHLLIQLASNEPAGKAGNDASVPNQSPVAAAIDSLPERSSGIALGCDTEGITRTSRSEAGREQGPKRPVSGSVTVSPGTVRESDQSRTLPSPVSIDEHVAYPNLSQALQELDAQASPPPNETTDDEDEDLDSDDDGRSPLQRFRSYPRRPLTVSDITSGAWCELQYWYTLTRLPGGRRTRTTAMKQGSKVHKQLEDEVHTTVKIEILSKEDAFGLRLWNLVQGLRTLRDTGLTRELEVWGMIDGNLVNGVIDSVSYENPNPEFEDELSSQGSQPRQNQRTVTDYFPPTNPELSRSQSPKIYLADVKTRGTLAKASAVLLRPAKIQLLLYHRFLSEMAASKLDFFRVFRRYGLDPDETFSDTFMAQMAELHDEIFFDTPTSSEEEKAAPPTANQNSSTDTSSAVHPPSSSPCAPDLLNYSSLRTLLPLIHSEIKLTFPLGAASLGHILRVQYVFRDDGRELDVHDFPVSRHALDTYLGKYMRWWRGERKATGVDIEEAFKCGWCEFAEGCRWRKEMDEERVRRAREKMSVGSRTRF